MLRTVTSGLAGLLLVASPFALNAQEEKDPAEKAAEAEAEAPAEEAPKIIPGRFFPDINYSTSEDLDDIWVLDLSNGERIKVRLMDEWAPKHVERIKTLTQQGFYDGVVFHRVIDGFMAQGGDPTATGQGGSTLPDLEAEFNTMPHVRGTLSMARWNTTPS